MVDLKDMERDDDFWYYHRYRRLVRRNLVTPLTHYCGGEYYSSMGKDNDEFILVCPNDGQIVMPGTKVMDKIKSTVKRMLDE